jgi:23S rRNA (uracil1939-C5)-methyltransferase
LILRHLDPITRRDLAHIDQFSRSHRVRCFGQSGGYETITPISANAHQPYLSYGNADYGLHFLFRPADFTQVNLAMNRKLVRAALAGLRAPAGARVLDLFCGIGNFTLALAATGLEAVGIEAAAQSIERARMNADHNGLGGRCEFVVQDLYDADCLNLGRAEYLLLDPPRSGAGPNLPAWVDSSGADRIAYVSCSPESFAVDAKALCRNGFELEEVGIFDMFPHTAHVETLGVFQKRW